MYIAKVRTVNEFRRAWLHSVHGKRLAKRAAIIIAVLAFLAFIGHFFGQYVPYMEHWINHHGALGVFVFFVAFFIGTIFFVPEAVFEVAGGVLFGIWWGTAVVTLAGMITGIAVFLSTRHLFLDRALKMCEKHPKLAAVRHATEKNGLRMMFLLRLAPINFMMLNFMLGVTKVRFTSYLISFIGTIPGIFAAVYFGHLAKHVTKIAGHVDTHSVTEDIVELVGFIVVVIVTTYITYEARKALREAEREMKTS